MNKLIEFEKQNRNSIIPNKIQPLDLIWVTMYSNVYFWMSPIVIQTWPRIVINNSYYGLQIQIFHISLLVTVKWLRAALSFSFLVPDMR